MSALSPRYNTMFSLFGPRLQQGQSSLNISQVVESANHFSQQRYQSDVFNQIDILEKEAEALYTIFTDSQHNPKQLADSGLVEMLAFTSQLLVLHYQDYQNATALKLHQQRVDALKKFADKLGEPTVATVVTPQQDGVDSLSQRLAWIIEQAKAKFQYIMTMLSQPSVLRDQLSTSNITRIYWVFCHFCLNQLMTLVKDSDILDKLGQILGRQIDLGAFSDALNTPNDVLNVLSVAFFAGRLLVDFVMVAKHAIGANEQERAKTSFAERFWTEFNKRGLNMLNCTVWGGVNLLTNYYDLFGIPVEWAFPIVAGVLVFDVALLGLLYNKEQSEYHAALDNLELQINALKPSEPMLEILIKQRQVLSEQWAIKQDMYQFNTIAATTLLASFSASLFMVSPAAILACYLVCCLTVAMYASNGEYQQYVIASKKLEHAQSQEGLSGAAQLKLAEAKEAAWQGLVVTLAERAFLPIGLFALVGLNPVIGLSTVAAYLTYKINQAFNQDQPKPVADDAEQPLVSDHALSGKSISN